MNIVFDDAANEDLRRIHEWISEDNPAAAYRLMLRIEGRIRLLAVPGMACMGRSGLIPGTFELVESPYIVVYAVDNDRHEIRVLSVVHGARDR